MMKCKHPSPGNSRVQEVFNCRGRGIKRVMLGTIHGVTDPIMCGTHSDIWSDRGYRVMRFDPRRWCDGCENEIDPDTCHCGEAFDTHNRGSGHAPVAMGCQCPVVKNKRDDDDDDA